MQIILEGPDNAGKSTLAAHISERLGIPIQHSGGPSKFPGEVNTRTFEFNQRRATFIYDRHPAISQNIYVEALQNNGELVEERHVDQTYELKPLIIYCKNTRGADGHEQSEHSSPEYFQQVAANLERLCDLYDAWAVERANIVYRIGDDMNDIANAVAAILYSADNVLSERPAFDPIADMITFHEKFGIAYNGKPRLLPADLASFRGKFMLEEVKEWEDAGYDAGGALDVGDEAEFVHQLELQFDAMIDLMYVQLGTVYLQGFASRFVEGWNRVHAANMKKVRAPSAEASAASSGRGHASDVIKPPGWEPPKHTDLIEDHEHRSAFRVEKDPIMRALDLG